MLPLITVSGNITVPSDCSPPRSTSEQTAGRGHVMGDRYFLCLCNFMLIFMFFLCLLFYAYHYFFLCLLLFFLCLFLCFFICLFLCFFLCLFFLYISMVIIIIYAWLILKPLDAIVSWCLRGFMGALNCSSDDGLSGWAVSVLAC